MLISCPTCQGALRVPAEIDGRAMRCPHCQGMFQIHVPAPVKAPEPVHRLAELDAVPELPPPAPVVLEPVQEASPGRERRTERIRSEKSARGFDDYNTGADLSDGASVEEVQEKVRPAAMFLTATGTVFLLFAVFTFCFGLSEVGGFRRGRTNDVVGFFICGSLFLALPIVFILIAGSRLKQLRDRNLVVTGAVMAILVGSVAGIILVFSLLMAIFQSTNNSVGSFLISTVILAVVTGFGLGSGVRTMNLVNQEGIREVFNKGNRLRFSRRRRPD